MGPRFQIKMHPPLDRPHPRCQEAIDGLRNCHAEASKLKFWACNEVKAKLDRCFKEEKEEMLRQMNSNLDEKKKRRTGTGRSGIWSRRDLSRISRQRPHVRTGSRKGKETTTEL